MELVRPENPRRVPGHPGDESIPECVKATEFKVNGKKLFSLLIISLFVTLSTTLAALDQSSPEVLLKRKKKLSVEECLFVTLP